MTRRDLIAGGTTVLATSLTVPVRAQTPTIKIGVLTDMSGPSRDVTGSTSVAAAKQAAAEFMAANPSIPVEVVFADHQNKPDVGVTILRGWFDHDGVDVVADLPNSAVALAASSVAAEKNKVCIVCSGGSSLLTGERCNANTVHWTQDSWNVAHTAAAEIVKTAGKTWFIVSPNFAYGQALTADLSRFVQAEGGSVLGTAFYPFPDTKDFASFILQAQSSRARVVCFAYGGEDIVNFIKQAKEFGLGQSERLAAPAANLTDVMGMGLDLGQGLLLAEGFYWDLNPRSRAWYDRIKVQLPKGIFPNVNQASTYAGPFHYLKAVKELGVQQAKASGREAVKMMKSLPTDDDCFGPGSIRVDGRKLQPSYLFEVKAPADSTHSGDVYKLVATTPAELGFRPLADGGCAFAKF
jgi:branched-chain amino acid transport system substrate-binding protein